MLDDTQFVNLFQDEIVKYKHILSVDCGSNILTLLPSKQSVNISEKQKRLLVCLLNGVNKKSEVIKIVWCENHAVISDNSYHQLLYQFRALLLKNSMPPDLIRTIPRYGVKLNYRFLDQLDLTPVCTAIGKNDTNTAMEMERKQMFTLPMLGKIAYYVYIIDLVVSF